MSVAKSMIESGMYENILIIGVEKFSSFLDWSDRNISVLFADGAGAAVIGRSNGSSEILSTTMNSDGSKAESLYMPGGGSVNHVSEDMIKNKYQYMRMDGKEVYKSAVKRMPEALNSSMKKANVSPDELDFIIFHQANIRIINSIAKRYNWNKEQIIVNINKYGNTSAGTIPIALAEAMESGKIKKGDLVGFSAFGAGFTWAGAVVKI